MKDADALGFIALHIALCNLPHTQCNDHRISQRMSPMIAKTSFNVVFLFGTSEMRHLAYLISGLYRAITWFLINLI